LPIIPQTYASDVEIVMARRLRDAALDSREARRKLKARGEPYYRAVERGVHLGYRRRADAAGTWLMRHYAEGVYRADRIATADDLSDADGVTVLDYWQAVAAVRDRMAARGRAVVEAKRNYTVADAMTDYIAHLETEGRTPQAIQDTRYRTGAFILPKLGKYTLGELTADKLKAWRDGLAKAQQPTGHGRFYVLRSITPSTAARWRRMQHGASSSRSSLLMWRAFGI
jgi:hypothetical protein